MNKFRLSRKQWLLYLPPAFLPVLLYGTNMLILHLTGHSVTLIPTISDEMFWYHQIAGMVDEGLPLGYYGYNGQHAQIGNLGPWGVVILLPYVIWGKIFGFALYSMFAANLAFLGISLSLFMFLARPEKKELVYLVIGYSTLLFNTHYCATAMSEPLHYSLAIVLTGCMVRLMRRKCSRLFTWVVVPLLLVFSTQAYLLLALFVPVYLLLVLPIRRPVIRLAVSVVMTLPYAFGMRAVFRMTQATYASHSSFTSWTALLRSKLSGALGVLNYLLPGTLWQKRTTASGFLSLMLVMYVLVIAAAVLIRRGIQCGRYALLTLFLMAGALACYCVLYPDPSMWTLCRGLNTVLCCGVLLLALSGSRGSLTLCLCCALITLPSFYLVSVNNQNRRVWTQAQTALYETVQEEFDELMDISPDNTRWENTIAQYGSRKDGDQTVLTLALPRSAGYNIMLNTSVISDAGYAVVYHSFSDEARLDDLLARLQEAGYVVIYEHETMTLLQRWEE